MSDKKVYLVITPFFPHEEHFVGSYIYDQVRALQRNSEYDIRVLKIRSFFETSQGDSYYYDGVECFVFRVLDLPSSILPGLFHSINLMRLQLFFKKVMNIEPGMIEIVHAHVIYPAGELAISLGKQFNARTFIQHHGLDVFQKDNGRILKGILKAINYRYMKTRFLKTTNAADLNIGVSQKVVDALTRMEGVNPFIKTYVLYNGVDECKFYKKDNAPCEDEFTIGCIGNFWPLKDQITLLKALKILKEEGLEIKTKFIGSGPTFEACMNYVENEHLVHCVEFLSEVDHSQLNNFYNKLHIFVLPSYYEALGCVYLEALQVGVPIIAVEGQGIEEVLKKQDHSKCLIKRGDFKQLAEKISTFYFTEERTVESAFDIKIDTLIKKFIEDIDG